MSNGNYSVKLFDNAAALKAACEDVSRTALYLYQDAFLLALATKQDSVKSDGKKRAIKNVISALNAAPGSNLESTGDDYRKALKVMIATGVPADFVLRTVRGATDNGESQTFNVNGISKALKAGIALLSDSPLWDTGNDPETLRGTIMALLHPNPRMSTASMLDVYMSKLNRGKIKGRYTSGGTQSSSSAHALSALGLVTVPQQGVYNIVNDAARDTLKRMIGMQQTDEGGSVNDSAMLAALSV